MARRLTRRHMLAAGLSALALQAPAFAASAAQEAIEKARLTVLKMTTDPQLINITNLLRRCKGVLIFPSLLKAGFFFGVEGGTGVLLARDSGGGWTFPAFYSMGAGSFGLQIGVQDSEVLLIIMTDSGLQAILNQTVKLGGDLALTVGPVGAGIEGATTLAVGADIVSYARSAGVFGGVSVEGAVIFSRNDMIQEYYGAGATAQSVIMEARHTNAAADELRAALPK